MQYSVRKRIALMMGVILLVGLLSMTLIYQALLQARRAVQDTERIYEPLTGATQAMGDSATRTVLQLLDYADRPAAAFRQEIRREQEAFNNSLRTYERLARSEGAWRQNRVLKERSDRFNAATAAILTHRDRREAALQQLRKELDALEEIVTFRIEARMDLNAVQANQKLYQVRALDQAVDHVRIFTRHYLEWPRREWRVRVQAASLDFVEALKALRGTRLTPAERRRAAELQRRFASARRAVTAVLTSDEELRAHFQALRQRRGELYAALREAQAAIRQDARLSRGQAEQAFSSLLHTTGLLIPLFVLAGLLAAIALIRSVNNRVRVLMQGTEAVGAGDLGYRLPERGRDEFATLAVQFNRMVSRLQATTVSAERLEASEQRFREANAALREADKRKDAFLAMLGHELRNPLAAIANSVALLRASAATPALAARAKDVLERQVIHMSRLVDDLLDLSRVTRSKVELRRETVDLRGLVSSAVQAALPQAHARGQELSSSVPAQPLWVNADPTRIEQVVANLLNNAIKYTEPGGQVRVTLERGPDEEGVIRVRDTGAGIPAEMLPQIFEVFTQMDQTLDRSQGGLGIGLSLVRSLVQLHGGSVTAHSEGEGKGAEFVVRLPLLKDEGGRMKDEGLARGALHPAAQGSRPSGVRVLVVDDNRDAAESLAELLELWGSTVQVAFNGTDALSAAAGFRPEVVLLDIGLPDTDGYEVARRLRQRSELQGVLLAAVTGYGQEEDRRRAREAGFDLHLTKPVDPETLRDLLSPDRAT